MAWPSYSVSRDAKRSLSGVPCDGVYERGCHYRSSCWQLLSETQCASPNGTFLLSFFFHLSFCLETAASGWHTFPSMHIHFSNHLSQDQCRMLAHVSKHPISHLKLLSRSLGCCHTFTIIHFFYLKHVSRPLPDFSRRHPKASTFTSTQLAPSKVSCLLPPCTTACSNFVSMTSRAQGVKQNVPVEEVTEKCLRCGICWLLGFLVALFG